jgi:oligoribonuclease
MRVISMFEIPCSFFCGWDFCMSEAKKNSTAYVWFDAEFTSLELDTARLLQVAAIVTDTELNRIAPAEADLNLCIRIEDGEQVSPWVAENLSGLVKKCKSNEAVSAEEADRQLAVLLDTYCGTPCGTMADRPVLAGNSVHNDWLLMRKFLPSFGSRLHYRLLDVSTIKIQWQDWIGGEPFDKESVDLLNRYFSCAEITSTNAHDALFDIKASIAELAFYRSKLGLKSV